MVSSLFPASGSLFDEELSVYEQNGNKWANVSSSSALSRVPTDDEGDTTKQLERRPWTV